MTFYVQRLKLDDPSSNIPFGRVGYVGPFRTEARAEREARAWNETGTWFAAVLDATPDLRAEVRAWQKQRRRG